MRFESLEAPDVVGDVNASTYADPSVAKHYEADSSLQPAEAAILERIRPHVAGRGILDLGVGAGRTVPYLLNLSEKYVGVDYSREMVAACRKKYPGVDIREGDARNLRGIEAEACHLVMFSFNGIDYVNHADRLKVLAEIRRVLAPNGYFVFSSHNLSAFRRPNFEWTLHPRRLVSRLVEWLPVQHHRLRNRRRETRSTTYSILNDGAHGFRLLTYHIDLRNQIEQLHAAGFGDDVAVFDAAGKQITVDTISPWLYYCVRKP